MRNTSQGPQGWPLVLLLLCINISSGSLTSEVLDIKLGFLTKLSSRERFKNGRSADLLNIFNHGVAKLNQVYGSPNGNTGNSSIELRFRSLVAATHGNESESIRQTVGLIVKQNVAAIVGPHDTCRVESRLASVYNVAMVSHYCSQLVPAPMASPHSASTFVHVKPPAWKIVDKVLSVVGHLLSACGSYSGRLVLLYHKAPTPTAVATSSSAPNRQYHSPLPSGRQQVSHGAQPLGQTSDASQNKLIGELLEVRLRELLDTKSTCDAIGQHKQLSVLNWHTTYLHGYTKNPFRRLIRRHLMQQRASAPVSSANQDRCSGTQSNSSDAETATRGDAVYIVVGHYYEHLGLMLALDELNLLEPQASAATDHWREQQPLGSGYSRVQPSVLAAEQQQESGRKRQPQAYHRVVVVGVDIEPNDGRVDSVHFLRGLLSGGGQRSSEREDVNLSLLAAKYTNYLGVVPSRPPQVSDLQDYLQSIYNRTQTVRVQLRDSLDFVPADVSRGNVSNASLADSNDRILDSLQLQTDLFQFLKLPVEAFYLYDSVLLLGSYFNDCLRNWRYPLTTCSEGQRIFSWFANQSYYSFVNHYNMTKFDSRAQADGFYSLISSSQAPDPSGASDDSSSEDELGLVPIGQFAANHSGAIELLVGIEEVGEIWLPFWCQVLATSNLSVCDGIRSQQKYDYATIKGKLRYQESEQREFLALVTVTSLILVLICSIVFVVTYLHSRGRMVSDAKFDPETNQLLHSDKSRATGGIDETDEQNFKHIVLNLLNQADDYYLESDRPMEVNLPAERHALTCRKALVELHCYMFSFPSCKFVHWLVAMRQLKEMMFQFQANLEAGDQAESSDWRRRLFGLATLLRLASNSLIDWRRRGREPTDGRSSGSSRSRAFFATEHEGSKSLRLVLHKYKSINDCLCSLHELNHPAIVQLVGTTLASEMSSRARAGKVACLIVELPARGNLRTAMRTLAETLNGDASSAQADPFKELLLFTLLDDLLCGLDYLFRSRLRFHGELRATNCMVTNNWRLKLTGFHQHHMRRSLGAYEQKDPDCNSNSNDSSPATSSYLDDLIYQAPEVLANHNRRATLSQSCLKIADIYSFGFVLYELLVDREPWSCLTQVSKSKLLIERVRVDSSFRPPLWSSDAADREQVVGATSASALPLRSPPTMTLHFLARLAPADSDTMQQLIRSCWSHSPARRPQAIGELRTRLAQTSWWSRMSLSERTSTDKIMESYAEVLERLSSNRKQRLSTEAQKIFELEHCLLPELVTRRLNSGQESTKRHFECVGFCLFRFIIIPNAQLCPVETISKILVRLDQLVAKYKGHLHLSDSVANSSLCFLVHSADDSTKTNQNRRQYCSQLALVASFALQLIELINSKSEAEFSDCVQVKCALHCGPAVGGVISGLRTMLPFSCLKLPRYVLFGRSLSMLESLEAGGLPQRIIISADYRAKLLSLDKCQRLQVEESADSDISGNRDYSMIRREAKIQAKFCGELEAFWLLNGPRLSSTRSLMLPSPTESF